MTSWLHPDTRIGPVALAVSDLDRSIAFYEQVLGFNTIDRRAAAARLGADMNPLLLLRTQAQARPRPPGTTGLYHFAILTPSRADLGRTLRHLLNLRYPLQGAADHLVSEAIYLADPDGNGIEVYRDRPRSEWNWEEGQVRMANAALDVEGLLAAAERAGGTGVELAPATTIGHVHLQVGNVEHAERFYCKLLGFEVMARWPGAIFVAAGTYHHHLGLNVWESRDAPPPPAESVGLRYYTILLASQAELADVGARLRAAGITMHESAQRLALRDPWQNGIVLTVRGNEELLDPRSDLGAS